MTSQDLFVQMVGERNNFNPPLEIKDIYDFVYTPLSDQKQHEDAWDFAERLKAYDAAEKKWWFVNYTTKKELKQALAETNREIDEWMDRKRKKIGFIYDLVIEDCLLKKKRLHARLGHGGAITSHYGQDKDKAKLIPIDHFIEFNSAGFAKCLWHTEAHGSMHLLPDKKGVWCFGGCGRHDVIDVVQAINNCSFSEAVKIILNK